MIKKIVTMLTAFCFLLTCFPLRANAVDEELPPDSSDDIEETKRSTSAMRKTTWTPTLDTDSKEDSTQKVLRIIKRQKTALAMASQAFKEIILIKDDLERSKFLRKSQKPVRAAREDGVNIIAIMVKDGTFEKVDEVVRDQYEKHRYAIRKVQEAIYDMYSYMHSNQDKLFGSDRTPAASSSQKPKDCTAEDLPPGVSSGYIVGETPSVFLCPSAYLNINDDIIGDGGHKFGPDGNAPFRNIAKGHLWKFNERTAEDRKGFRTSNPVESQVEYVIETIRQLNIVYNILVRNPQLLFKNLQGAWTSPYLKDKENWWLNRIDQKPTMLANQHKDTLNNIRKIYDRLQGVQWVMDAIKQHVNNLVGSTDPNAHAWYRDWFYKDAMYHIDDIAKRVHKRNRLTMRDVDEFTDYLWNPKSPHAWPSFHPELNERDDGTLSSKIIHNGPAWSANYNVRFLNAINDYRVKHGLQKGSDEDAIVSNEVVKRVLGLNSTRNMEFHDLRKKYKTDILGMDRDLNNLLNGNKEFDTNVRHQIKAQANYRKINGIALERMNFLMDEGHSKEDAEKYALFSIEFLYGGDPDKTYENLQQYDVNRGGYTDEQYKTLITGNGKKFIAKLYETEATPVPTPAPHFDDETVTAPVSSDQEVAINEESRSEQEKEVAQEKLAQATLPSEDLRGEGKDEMLVQTQATFPSDVGSTLYPARIAGNDGSHDGGGSGSGNSAGHHHHYSSPEDYHSAGGTGDEPYYTGDDTEGVGPYWKTGPETPHGVHGSSSPRGHGSATGIGDAFKGVKIESSRAYRKGYRRETETDAKAYVAHVIATMKSLNRVYNVLPRNPTLIKRGPDGSWYSPYITQREMDLLWWFQTHPNEVADIHRDTLNDVQKIGYRLNAVQAVMNNVNAFIDERLNSHDLNMLPNFRRELYDMLMWAMDKDWGSNKKPNERLMDRHVGPYNDFIRNKVYPLLLEGKWGGRTKEGLIDGEAEEFLRRNNLSQGNMKYLKKFMEDHNVNFDGLNLEDTLKAFHAHVAANPDTVGNIKQQHYEALDAYRHNRI